MTGELAEYRQERKGFWHEPGGEGTSEAIALQRWAREMDDVLLGVAETYHETISEADLATRLQERSGIHTTRPPDRWLTKLLVPLAALHHREGRPALTALVVDRHGWVGERYDELLRAADQLPPHDVEARERHAARARLECYRWAGSAPADGGEPARVPVAAGRQPGRSSRSAASPRSATRARSAREPAAPARRRVARSDQPVAVCPTCFMALPATGVCDSCG